jgi:flagellar hook protein FlgE
MTEQVLVSVLRAMYSGVSGLQAEGEALGVVGDNIANGNTVGFKAQRSVFQDVLGRSVGGEAHSAGAGVRHAGVQQVFTQGSLSNTGVATDLALSGDGFFVLQGSLGGVTGDFYTRNGQWTIDKDGFVANASGLKARGYPALPDGTFASSPTALQVPTAAISPRATTKLAVTANLDANTPVATVPWNAQDPAGTSSSSVTISVYDSLGNARSLDVYFRKTMSNTWEWHAVAKSSDVTSGTGTYTEVGSGTLGFTTNGALSASNVTSPIAVNWNGAAAQSITADFGSAIGAAGSGLDGVTQFASPFGVSSQSQDGYGSGNLSGIGVDSNGTVTGMYTNGQRLPVGRLAIAKFQASEQLARAGDSMWVETRGSGSPALGVAGTGGRGAVTAGALERSNVDLAQQFVDLIAHQRAFEANSKTIATADEMLQALQNLKR